MWLSTSWPVDIHYKPDITAGEWTEVYSVTEFKPVGKTVGEDAAVDQL